MRPETLTFAAWLSDLSTTHGRLVEREHDRIYVAKVGTPGLCFCLNITTETAWLCRADQLGRWFRATTPVQPLRIEPEYVKAWASRL